ncbi:MAG: protein kinase, partial [Planctomycetales bacterium]
AAYFGGSLAYMSPEQLEAANVNHERAPDSLDGQSDVYSLGIVLWELLTGDRPFGDEHMATNWNETVTQLTKRRREGVPASAVAKLPEDCPRGLSEVLLGCLEPDPESRLQSGEEAAHRLALCLEPRAWDLLNPPAGTWRRKVQAAPALVVLLTALIPNVLAAIFNFAYNQEEIVKQLQKAGDPLIEAAFWNTQSVINSIAFPVGLAVLAALAWPLGVGLRNVRLKQSLSDEDRRALRRLCLNIGHYAAAIGIVEWIIAGVAYPITLHALGARMPLDGYLHFIISLTICGLIAAAYPFFFATFLGIRACYPAVVAGPAGTDDELNDLKRLAGSTLVYLIVAACVPMLAVTLLALAGLQNQLALFVLGAVGFAGFLLLARLYQVIQADLSALEFVARPLDANTRGDSPAFSGTISRS